jgi:hypothetical protein
VNVISRDEVFLGQQRDVVAVLCFDVFCQFEVRIPEFHAMFSVQCTKGGHPQF